MYRITNPNNFHEINCKTSRYKNSFFPNADSIWNKMITDFQEIQKYVWYTRPFRSLLSLAVESAFEPVKSTQKNAIILVVLLLIFASVNMVSRIFLFFLVYSK